VMAQVVDRHRRVQTGESTGTSRPATR